MALQPLFIRGWKQLSAYVITCGSFGKWLEVAGNEERVLLA